MEREEFGELIEIVALTPSPGKRARKPAPVATLKEALTAEGGATVDSASFAFDAGDGRNVLVKLGSERITFITTLEDDDSEESEADEFVNVAVEKIVLHVVARLQGLTGWLLEHGAWLRGGDELELAGLCPKCGTEYFEWELQTGAACVSCKRGLATDIDAEANATPSEIVKADAMDPSLLFVAAADKLTDMLLERELLELEEPIDDSREAVSKLLAVVLHTSGSPQNVIAQLVDTDEVAEVYVDEIELARMLADVAVVVGARS